MFVWPLSLGPLTTDGIAYLSCGRRNTSSLAETAHRGHQSTSHLALHPTVTVFLISLSQSSRLAQGKSYETYRRGVYSVTYRVSYTRCCIACHWQR